MSFQFLLRMRGQSFIKIGIKSLKLKTRIDTQTHRRRQTERQTDRQTDRQTHRQGSIRVNIISPEMTEFRKIKTARIHYFGSYAVKYSVWVQFAAVYQAKKKGLFRVPRKNLAQNPRPWTFIPFPIVFKLRKKKKNYSKRRKRIFFLHSLF